MSAYYNEIDPFAAAWLRSLIAAGHIAPGDVDERSITDVSPDDLVGYDQCHFFAGIGGWSLALQLAGVPDDMPVWTGSCPCQGLSIAGKRGMRTDDWQRLRAGHPDPVADLRHLWPDFHRLIRERSPPVVFGEQAASADGRTWLTAVRADLEDLGYGVGAADLCAAGVGAPHIRQRLWWGAVRVADARGQRLDGVHALLRAGAAGRDAGDLPEAAGGGGVGGVADAGRFGVRGAGSGTAGGTSRGVQGADLERERVRPDAGAGGAVVGGVADANDPRPQGRSVGRDGADQCPAWPNGVGDEGGSPSHVDWRAADWLRCRDGRWRPVEPGTCPLADGLSEWLVPLRTIEVKLWSEVMDACSCQADASEDLRMVRNHLYEEACREELGTGVRLQLPSPSLLLAILLCVQSAREPGTDGGGFAKACGCVRRTMLHGVRLDRGPCGPSCQWRSDGQLAGQPPDALQPVSLVLSRHAEAYRAAAAGAHGAAGRVGRLRGYGNAIAPAVAAAFVTALLDVAP